ncbi:hypothetical protein [uncultured Thioclava sp.]|uniref:hypothetical protein n=1 Tax=uncultured Thioclava sp. TaxID=473858 RepID=UPI0025D7B08A|nr:hypothetical protein [uncultured Thioclava sp.]
MRKLGVARIKGHAQCWMINRSNRRNARRRIGVVDIFQHQRAADLACTRQNRGETRVHRFDHLTMDLRIVVAVEHMPIGKGRMT